MPAGDPGSDEDTREYPVFTGPYPRPTLAGPSGKVPAIGQAPSPPPAAWPGEGSALGRGLRAPAVSSAAVERRAATYGTSVLAATAGIVLLLFGVILTIVGGAGVALPDLMDQVVRIARDADLDLRGRELRTLLTTGAWVGLVLGVLHLSSAFGVFGHREWGRLVGLALALPGTLLGAYGVAQSLTLSQAGIVVGAAPVAAAVIAMGYGIVLFGLVAGGSQFRRTDADQDNRWDGRPAR